MPTISKEKKDKIKEQILHYLFEISPEAVHTNNIAISIARDEEFTKLLLKELKDKNLVNEINRNQTGMDYIRRQRWRLSQQAFDIYSKHQSSSQQPL